VIPALLEVRVQEAHGEIRPPQPLEVHGEEGDLARRVAEAEAMVELDASKIRAADVLACRSPRQSRLWPCATRAAKRSLSRARNVRTYALEAHADHIPRQAAAPGARAIGG
jgi:hypothetical protein